MRPAHFQGHASRATRRHDRFRPPNRLCGCRREAQRESSMATLSFLGATGTVTGSKFLIEHQRVQAARRLRPVPGPEGPAPAQLEPAAGRARRARPGRADPRPPRPLRATSRVWSNRGFTGPVLATDATCDLCGILWPDCGHIQEEDARFANKRGYSKHAARYRSTPKSRRGSRWAHSGPCRSTKTHAGARGHRAPLLSGGPHPRGRVRRGAPGQGRRRRRCSSFSGDLGRPDQPILPDPTPLPDCDTLVMESTYGNRDHPDEDPKDRPGAVHPRDLARAARY